MTEQNVFSPEAPIAKAPAQAPRDLSAEIVARIEKESDERVTCRWIRGNSYRCNWWAAQNTKKYDNPLMEGLLVTTHRVRRSRFLNVTKIGEALVIEDSAYPGRQKA